MEDYKLCEGCGEEIEHGRSDKRFCNKQCYNHSKNIEYRNTYQPIKRGIDAYKRSYKALFGLIQDLGTGAEIRLSQAVQMGLDRKSPCLLIRLKHQEGTFSQIGNIAYQVSSDMKFIQIYIISDGKGN